ncbi:spermatogenesis associated 6-like protein isoform X5 [Mustela lutreola]|uniref:spermatogenesis associated 6-like protein isoform X5 n=1 Tax=Mustela lutreola TaxID=9666 RepID=UPI00279771F9|nr:spermatogenesis associated 6-like protein isoform X5 [Mustela lutreola]
MARGEGVLVHREGDKHVHLVVSRAAPAHQPLEQGHQQQVQEKGEEQVHEHLAPGPAVAPGQAVEGPQEPRDAVSRDLQQLHKGPHATPGRALPGAHPQLLGQPQISCPGVFLPDKQDVYLGVYLLNQYLETACFPSVFPIMIQQSMRFEKVFENAIDPGAVADILEMWEELACYEENTRDFLFPEPKLTPSLPGMCREVLMKTIEGFPGIAPKIEFSTRTAIRERVFLQRNRFPQERYNNSGRPLSATDGPKLPLNNTKRKPKDTNLNRLPQSMQTRAPSPVSARRCFHDQPAQLNLGNNIRLSGGSKPPFVVRHVDSAKPFGENISEYQSRKSRRKLQFSNLPFPGRRAASLDSLAANVKVIKEPDERIVLRKESSSPFDSSKFGKPSPSYSNQGDADFLGEASFTTSQHSRSASPPRDEPLLCDERFHPCSQSSWRKIHERVCSLLTSHRAQQNLHKEYSVSGAKYIIERPSYLVKGYPVHEQRYF